MNLEFAGTSIARKSDFISLGNSFTQLLDQQS
jgi:hypothetical protein